MSKRVLLLSGALVGILVATFYGVVGIFDYRVLVAIGLFALCYVTGARMLLSTDPPRLSGTSLSIVAACYWGGAILFAFFVFGTLAGLDFSFMKDAVILPIGG